MHFIGKWPQDTELTPVSRTVGEDKVVDEVLLSWDQASLLVQIGLLDPRDLPVTGAEQPENLLDPRARPPNELMGEHR